MKKRILLDLDGVIVDFVGGVCKWFGVKNPYIAGSNPPRGDLRAWDIVSLLGFDSYKFWNGLNYDFWAHLPQTKESHEIVQLAIAFVGADSVCFLSSPCRTPGCSDGKIQWVTKHFPSIPLILSVSIPGKAPPKEMLAGPDAILVDDYTLNVRKFIEYGGAGFLVPRPWNDDYAEEDSLVHNLRLNLEFFMAD
jgi:hypothetical protein